MTPQHPRGIVSGRAFPGVLAIVVAAGSLFLAFGAEASVILSEPFAYTTGDLNGRGGWSGSANWDVESVGLLSYPTGSNMTATGNQVAIEGGRTGEDIVTRTLGSALNFDGAGNTYYLSFLIRKDQTAATGNEYFWMTLEESASMRAAIGIGSGENLLVGINTSTFVTSPNTISGGTDYLYVAKILTSASGNDQYSVKVYDPSATVPWTEPGTWDRTYSAAMMGSANLLRLRAGPSGYYNVDEIRLGTSWSDVVEAPEPSTLAMLLSLGGMSLLGFRRKNSLRRTTIA